MRFSDTGELVWPTLFPRERPWAFAVPILYTQATDDSPRQTLNRTERRKQAALARGKGRRA